MYDQEEVNKLPNGAPVCVTWVAGNNGEYTIQQCPDGTYTIDSQGYLMPHGLLDNVGFSRLNQRVTTTDSYRRGRR